MRDVHLCVVALGGNAMTLIACVQCGAKLETDPVQPGYTPSHTCACAPATPIDFGVFWERVFAYSTHMRLQVCFDIATDERLSRELFADYSPSARLRRVAQVITADVLGERPAAKLVH